jgi:hypothetical protein
MVPLSTKPRIALLVALAAVLVIASGGVSALPGFSDGTGPSDARVTTLERLDAGCADDVADFSHSRSGGGEYERTTFVETGSAGADLSAWVERTSPPGADLSTFRVHVDSRGGDRSTGACRMGVQYRIVVETSGGTPEGLVPDADGTRMLWLHNGAVAGCSASVESPLDAECERFSDRTPWRVWANATGG